MYNMCTCIRTYVCIYIRTYFVHTKLQDYTTCTLGLKQYFNISIYCNTQLCNMEQSYLSIYCCTIILQITGLVNKQRSCLSPENIDHLLFLYENERHYITLSYIVLILLHLGSITLLCSFFGLLHKNVRYYCNNAIYCNI